MERLIFFWRLMKWFSVRHLRAHPWRVFAVLFGIALGAAVFSSVRLAVDASLDAFTRSMDLISGKAEWAVVKVGDRVPEQLVATLSRNPAVKAASPLISTYVSTPDHATEPFLLIGLDPILDYGLREWQILPYSRVAARIWLDLVTKPATLLTSRKLALKSGWKPGDELVLEHVHQTMPFKVIGLLQQEGLSMVEGGYVAITDIATIQEFMGIQGLVDRIDLSLKPSATAEDLQNLRSVLPPGVVLEAPSQTKETGESLIHAYQLNLSVLSFVSLFVGMFLVYSLVSLNVASRRRELAILRSLGASSRRLFALTLSEGFILGTFGWLLAIPVGSFLVKFLVQGVSGTINNLFVRVRVESLRLDPWEILLSFVATLAVSLVAASRPAVAATRIAPREAMSIHESAAAQQKHSGLLYGVPGCLCVALAWPVARIPGLPGFPLPGYLAVLMLVVGFSLLSLPVLHWMGSFLPKPLRRVAGEPAFLAGRYIRDAGPRIAISVGALMTAVALFVALVIMVHSFRYTVSLWVNQTLAGDFYLRPKMAGLNQYRDPLPQSVVNALKGLEGVELLPYRHLDLRHGKVFFEFEALRLRTLLHQAQFLMIRGDLSKIRLPLLSGQGALVSEVFENQTGLSAGDRLVIHLGKATLDLPILGVFRDYRTRGGIVYMDLGKYEEITGDPEWSGVRFFFKDTPKDMKAATDRLRSEIIRCCENGHPLEMSSGSELRREILQIFDDTFAVTTVLLLIALLVAGLGITTTLTVLVLERIRQLNTLLAVGAGSGQVRSMIFWEAILMVTAGEGVGLVCGFFMSYLLIFVINLQSFGWTFLYRVDWKALWLSLPLILATALLAALPAVRSALRSSPALVLKEP
jgi:putative ABC transport system permease protein